MAHFSYISELWAQMVFQLVHKTTIWMLFVFFFTALASWQLSFVLTKHNARLKEANLAKTAAIFYSLAGAALWMISFLFS